MCRASRWCCAGRDAEVEETDGSNSREGRRSRFRSLVMEVNNLEVDEDLTLFRVESVCKQYTAAFLTWHTRKFLVVCTWLLLNAVCVFLESHLISSMLHSTLLDHRFLHFSPHLCYTCIWFVCHSFVAPSFGESIHCHSARRVMLWPTG